MRLILISDTHCQHKALKMPEGDILIHAGDWTHHGEVHLTEEFVEWLDDQDYNHKLFIAGNHDFLPQRSPDLFKDILQTVPSVTYLQDSSVTINGYKFHGSPVSPWFCNWAFNRYRGNDIQKHWDMIPDDVDVLITHGPVQGYGDKLSRHGSEPGANVGCSNLLNTIDSRLKNLKLHVSGHIHEGSGTYQHNGIILVNASVLDERYRLRHEPVVIDLPDKTVSDPKEQ